ncbi:MAG: hypothetical protein E7158_04840 [Firmicutes bacterium]|nr:hypothetical protein [Bacillota bacterium]
MNKKELLRKIQIEDYIWIINFFIIIFALLSNNYEKDYIISGNTNSKSKYKSINIGIFIVLFIIYSYFAFGRIKKVNNEKNTPFNKEILIDEANLVAALLILLGSFIYLVDEIIDNNGIDVELL